ncbi:MAG: nucleotidyl transferase AbiEii/AbiGii toxin family protein [Bacteroidales bacterium]|jgi:predicted nucleotidyltransferase component of viral defense system|nr:nucleotidyl transferase AbiEii/AbiGii toxin family protein [Bacteroidales bacterium]
MINNQYDKQVELLLRILPFIAKEKDIALHGGTAINLFYFDIPRLSVDIDLTFLPFSTRDKDLEQIVTILKRLRSQLLKTISGINIKEPRADEEEYKLFCSLNNTEIKIEVNTINRGIYQKADILPLSSAAQERYNMFCEMPIVSLGQLFGGKIVAALDRQHPRDLFDVKKMLDTYGYPPEINKGFIFSLLSSKRPIHEILSPSFLNHEATLNSQFSGMTKETFTYDMYENTRVQLVEIVKNNISSEIAELIISFSEGRPKWSIFNFEEFPGIKWKLMNIKKLKEQNPEKHIRQMLELKKNLNSN